MGYYSNIFGTISGISKDSFDLIAPDLERDFEEFYHDPDEFTLEINSYGKHCDLEEIFDKIAFCIDEDVWDRDNTSLNIEGEMNDDISRVFFAPRQWRQLHPEIHYPESPFNHHIQAGVSL